MTRPSERSYEAIGDGDLSRLAEFALADLAGLVDRGTVTGRRYRDRLVCIVLCQGAALHYLDRRTGVKDFDVWSFFAAHLAAGRTESARRLSEKAAVLLWPPERRGETAWPGCQFASPRG